jgi:hypothetical protein
MEVFMVSISDSAIRQLADGWFSALDEHAPVERLTEFLVAEGFEMHLPEGILREHSGFADWYNIVSNLFFDEQQKVTSVEAEVNGDEAAVDIGVNWQARRWQPPAAASEWLGFDVRQRWVVVPDPAGEGIKIKSYAINGLTPMPGSASLAPAR